MNTQKVEEMVKDFLGFGDDEKKALGVIASWVCFVGGNEGSLDFLENLDRCSMLSREDFRKMQASDDLLISMDVEYNDFRKFFNSQEFKEWRFKFDGVTKVEGDVVVLVVFFKLAAEETGENAGQLILDGFVDRRKKDKDLDRTLRAVAQLLK